MRVLISPASKHGGTAEIGRAIARELRKRGIDVDVTQPEDIYDLDRYEGFVIGSALYMGSWLPNARRFVEDHRDAISRKPTWLFSSGPLGSKRPAEPIHADLLEHLLMATGAREHRLFGGRVELERLSRPERFVARWVGVQDGDHREWDDIERWTAAIASSLLGLAEPDHNTAPSGADEESELIEDRETTG